MRRTHHSRICIRMHTQRVAASRAAALPQNFTCYHRLRIALHGALSEEQQQRLLRAASHCPVKQVLMGRMAEGIGTVLVTAEDTR